jgi:HflK protein
MRRWWNACMWTVLVLGGGALLWDYLVAALKLVAESAPYLLLGFLLAGLLRAVVPEDKVYRQLGENRLKSVVLASLYGVPLPLCSCSVLPVASALRRSGASKGATTSFLISTPETGLDSISITYALLDPIMTVIRPVAAFVTALVTGSLVNELVKRGWDEPGGGDPDTLPQHDEHHQHEHDDVWSPSQGGRTNVWRALREASSYAFGPLMDDLTPWFIIGFLLSGVIAVAIPEGFFGDVVAVGWASSLLMLLIGTPVYICASAATPVAAALIAKGLDPGAALILLLVGPATNVTTMFIVARLLGKRVLVLHVLGVIGGALVFGSYVNTLYASLGLDLSSVVSGVVTGGVSPVNIAATVVLLFLLARSAVRVRILSQWGRQLRALGARLGFDPLSTAGRLIAVVLVVLAYLATSLSILRPGETAWVVRFGRIVQTYAEPGLIAHLPRPFESLVRLPVRQVRSIELGFFRSPAAATPSRAASAGETAAPATAPWSSMQRDFEAEAEVTTGEENLLRITCAVHFDVSEPYAYLYRLEDPVKVVRTFAAWALRQAVARRSASDILVGHREELEHDVQAFLQQELEAVGSGIRVRAVTLQDVHAVPEVHTAFRDVASALEDKERLIRQAQGYRAATLAQARARAFTAAQEAESYRSEKVSAATGESAAFLKRLQAYRQHRYITRLRLFFEGVEKVLRDVRAIFVLGDNVDVNLWNVRDGAGRKPETPAQAPETTSKETATAPAETPPEPVRRLLMPFRQPGS